jgi:ABC-type polysaccharide/polyol phosphate export permease
MLIVPGRGHHTLFIGVLMSYLRYLCLFACSGFRHILCCGFCCVCLRLVCPVLPVSLDCSFFVTPLVFSNVYLIKKIDIVHSLRNTTFSKRLNAMYA